MKKYLAVVSLISVGVFILLNSSCSSDNEKKNIHQVTDTISAEEVVKKGEYLVTILGCSDCHSPKRMGANGPEIIQELLLSGYPSASPIPTFTDPLIKQGYVMFSPNLAAAGPWGISFAANLTPDVTGIGTWTEEQFKKSLTKGKYKGLDNSRMILPPMPWTNYMNMKDEDVHAIFMYLKSINPVKNVIPEPIPPSQM
jgi:hypothetical protein